MARKIDKQALRMKIQELDIDNELKSQLLDAVSEKKTFGLVWENHPEDSEERLRAELPVLKEVKGKALLNGGKDAPNHILIEGDNLEALTALAYTHENSVDVIYIDPPYNTGNKDFVYNDSFVDSEDGFRHSKWVSFMEKRLRIAKKLLSDRGVIFISIDDNEQANLKLLCDEVFGENNFCAVYNWKRTETPPALSYKVRKKFEYVLCYQKQDIPQRKFSQGYTDGGDAPLLNNGNPIGELTFPAGSVHFNLPDGKYSSSNDQVIDLLDEVIVQSGINTDQFRARGHFKWQQSNLMSEVEQGTFFLVKGKTFSIRYQKNTKSIKVPSNIIDGDVNVGTNEEASKEMQNFGIDFDYAKPSSLIKFIISMPHPYEKNYTILDFFAGSGTTLHATMQLNTEDGGHRQCILVTNNENNICRDVTYERNKRVIMGYTSPKGVIVEGLAANNLRYYKTEFVSRQSSHQNKKEQAYAMLDLLCIKENVYDEKKVFGSLSLEGKEKLVRYFADDETKMLLIYDTRVVPYIVREIAGMAEENLNIKTYIFADGSYPYTADFEEVLSKVTLVAMPFSMNKALSNVLPAENDIELNDEPDTEEE